MLGAAAGTGVGAVVGLATLPVLGPVAGLAGVAVGAYVGSLAGALEQMNDPAGVAGRRRSNRPRSKSYACKALRTSNVPRATLLEAIGMTSIHYARQH